MYTQTRRGVFFVAPVQSSRSPLPSQSMAVSLPVSPGLFAHSCSLCDSVAQPGRDTVSFPCSKYRYPEEVDLPPTSSRLKDVDGLGTSVDHYSSSAVESPRKGQYVEERLEFTLDVFDFVAQFVVSLAFRLQHGMRRLSHRFVGHR
ncbi:hypothetical protein HPB49_019601 [Dermacentor silvarum]|uniref:Uncharacterized protein n=1 Tax=Dermacentor silvarum TaxID=543639 RepID=A0ACB8DFN7_DERSI|nr:hypothetical protein HPB49_019601 [Dermacentor silvarum]